MAQVLLSMMAIYNYGQYNNDDLFENFYLPTQLDKETLITNLLFELAELEVLYSDYEFMKSAIGWWSKKELSVWEKEFATTILEYDPIENYNRTETTTDVETRDLSATDNETRDLSATDNETRDLAGQSKTVGTSTGSEGKTGTDVDKNLVAGYNSETPSLAEQKELTLGTTTALENSVNNTEDVTDTGTVNISKTDVGTINKNQTDTGTVKQERSSNTKGNIGVTTSQQMIEQERNVAEFNIYDYIIQSFKKRFCIMVY